MDPKLLDILVCPLCKGSLKHDRSALELICEHDALAFPIRDSIPVLIVEKARSLDGTQQATQLPAPSPENR
jgi:uncharacterized protein YbaR (Trm112 family)